MLASYICEKLAEGLLFWRNCGGVAASSLAMAIVVGRRGPVGATGSASIASCFFGNAVAKSFVTLRSINAVRGVFVAEVSASARVVVTREHGKNGKLMKALEKRGIQCLELPLIEHRDGPDLPQLVQTLREVKFEWIIVTSPEAATVFLQAWREAGCPKVRIAVVGSGTGELFQNAKEGPDLLEVAFTPSKATAKVLASELPKIGDGDNHVLYPASLKAGDDLATGLTERGFLVLRMNTYSTETVRNLDEAAIASAASAPVATFASPTAVRAWMELVAEPRKWDGAAACIGSTSANAASKAGLQKIYHPESPGIEGWVESIMEALEAQKLEANAL